MRISDIQLIGKDALDEFSELIVGRGTIDHAITSYDDKCVIADKVMLISFVFEDEQKYCPRVWVLTAFDSKHASREVKQIRSTYEYINFISSNGVVSISDNMLKHIEELEPTYYTARMKSLIKRTRRYAVNMINQHGDKELIGNRKIYFDDLFIGEKEEMDDIVEKLKRGEEL